jgi:hypothetical protein
MAAREYDDPTDDLEARITGLEAKLAKLQALVIDDFVDLKHRLRDLSVAAVPEDDA